MTFYNLILNHLYIINIFLKKNYQNRIFNFHQLKSMNCPSIQRWSIEDNLNDLWQGKCNQINIFINNKQNKIIKSENKNTIINFVEQNDQLSENRITILFNKQRKKNWMVNENVVNYDPKNIHMIKNFIDLCKVKS